MKSWLKYLRRGLSGRTPPDPVIGPGVRPAPLAALKNLRPYFKRHWRKGVAGFGLVGAVILLGFPPPLLTRYLVDDVILGRQRGALVAVLALIFGFLAAEKVLRLLKEYYFTRLEQRITMDIQQDLIAHVLRLPKSFFDDTQSGYLVARLTEDVEGIRWFFSETVADILANLLRFAGGLGVLFFLQWQLALAVLVFLPALAFGIRYFGRKIHALGHRHMERRAEFSGHLQESVHAAELIKAHAREDFAVAHLTAGLKNLFQVSLEQATVNSLASMLVGALPGIARGIVLAVGAWWIILEQWSLGSLLAFQAYLAYVFGPAQYLASANIQLQEALAAMQRVAALFDVVVEENVGCGRKVARLAGEVEFKDVTFGYNAHQPVLKNVSLRVRPGEKVAIAGPSGVGKTTLLSLIMRFYHPSSGEILFDGRPAATFEVGSLRERIGYVGQQPRLLNGTIVENICYGNPAADMKAVAAAARAAGIHKFVESLPRGYDTVIGEQGVHLSQGQKQRLALARALVKNPDILILDEPTAALDNAAEKAIFKMLPAVAQDKTVFVVAHRLANIQGLDHVFLLKQNRLEKIDAQPELMEGGSCLPTALQRAG